MIQISLSVEGTAITEVRARELLLSNGRSFEDSAMFLLTFTVAEIHSFKNPHFLPGVEFPKEFQAKI